MNTLAGTRALSRLILRRDRLKLLNYVLPGAVSVSISGFVDAPLLGLTVLATALTALGLSGLRRRDLG